MKKSELKEIYYDLDGVLDLLIKITTNSIAPEVKIELIQDCFHTILLCKNNIGADIFNQLKLMEKRKEKQIYKENKNEL